MADECIVGAGRLGERDAAGFAAPATLERGGGDPQPVGSERPRDWLDELIDRRFLPLAQALAELECTVDAIVAQALDDQAAVARFESEGGAA